MPSLRQLMSENNYEVVSLGEIDFNTESEEQIEEFASFVERNPNFKSVSFWGKFRTNRISLLDWKKVWPVLQAIAKNKNIYMLSFSSCCIEELNEEQVQVLQDFIKISSIRDVSFESDHVLRPCPVLDFITSIPETPVENLSCNMLGFGKENFAVVQKLKLLSSGNLNKLSLRSNFIGRNSVLETENDSYANFLTSLFGGEFKSIDLAHNQLTHSTTTNDWKNIFNAVNENKSLQSLDLASCGFEILIEDEENENDEFIVMLENFLRNTTLREINLTGNQFWDGSTKRILKAALQNPNLVLKLDKTGLSERVVKELRESIQKELSEQKKPLEQEHKENHDLPSSASKPLILSNGINSGNLQGGINNPQNPDSPRSKDKLKK